MDFADKMDVLIVEDEDDIRALLVHHFRKEGFTVREADNGRSALEEVRREQPNLVILDLMLPKLDGSEVCRSIKSNPLTRSVPVVMLTAKDRDSDVISGLDIGADDYVTKPFSPSVLMARARSLLRRLSSDITKKDQMLAVERIVIDLKRHIVKVDDEPIELTFTEFAILHLLASHRGRVFSRSQIVESIRGGDYPVTDRAVDVHIAGLRKKLGFSGTLIETVRGVGYRFSEVV